MGFSFQPLKQFFAHNQGRRRWGLIAASVLVVGLALFGLGQRNQSRPADSRSDSSEPSAQPAPPRVLLQEAFAGPDQLLLTDSDNPAICAPASERWAMTNGSLFVRDRTGYSGLPTVAEEYKSCPTVENAGSNTFRMHSKQADFTDNRIQLDYKLIAQGSGGGASHSYDGLHVWTRHESQYALYAVSIGRWDGTFAIKKKLPTSEVDCEDSANDGCYIDLAKQVRLPDLVQAGTWHKAEIITSEADGQLKIELTVDGQKIMTAYDDGQKHGRIITKGAIGIRGDNTEFYIRDMQVFAP